MNKKDNATPPASDAERALGSALNILAYAECTEKGLRQKLEKKGYAQESIDFAVDYMQKHRYLNEKRYLFRLVEYLGNTRLYGRRRIAMTLKEKGFAPETISDHLDAALQQIDERNNCRLALPKVKKDSPKKTIDALLRRGFLYGDIKAVMSEIEDDCDTEF